MSLIYIGFFIAYGIAIFVGGIIIVTIIQELRSVRNKEATDVK